MQLISLDFESYYTDKANGEYSLTWMTNEEYVRDPRFESIGFAIAVGNEEPVWYSGDHAYQQSVLNRFDWDDAVVVGHNMSEFDSLILSHHFGIVPRAYACTLQMARRWHGAKVSNSLGNLAKMYNLYAEKGTEVEDARNKRRKDFTDAQLAAYGAYCVKDVKLCRQLYHQFRPRFPADEQRLMSLFTRMYADARLHLDGGLIRTMVEDIAVRKSGLLDQVADMLQLGVGLPREERMTLVQKELRSDAKFARILDEEFGIEPPTKLSPKQKNADGSPKVVFAFAKTDEAMAELLEDEDPDVQALAAARLGVKSTIAESRLLRFQGIAERGPLPVPLVYGKTHTDRAAGGGKINLQNMSRPAKPGPKTPMGTLVNVGGRFDRLHKYNKLKELFMLSNQAIIKPKEAHIAGLRDAIIAPPGYKLVVADSSNIELRVCHLLAGQLDTIAKLRQGVDLYCDMGQDLYGYPVTKANEKERQHGKVAHLQLQFQSGAGAFRRAARIMGGIRLTQEEADSTVEVYRAKHREIAKFWRRCRDAVEEMYNGQDGYLDQWGLVKIAKNKLVMPNGMSMEYFDLREDRFNQDDPTEPLCWMYDDKETRKRKKAYGGSVCENCLAEGTQVLTARGWVSIESVRDEDLVHDGVEFVSHGGTVFKSFQPCVTVDGVYMTADHEVLTDAGWQAALEEPRPYRPDLRGVDCITPSGIGRKENEMGVPLSVRDTGDAHRDGRVESGKEGIRAELRMQAASEHPQAEHDPRYEPAPGVRGVAVDAGPLPATDASSVEELRCAGDHGVPGVDDVRAVLEGHGANIRVGAVAGQDRQRPGLRAGQLPVGDAQDAVSEQAQQPAGGHCGSVEADRDTEVDAVLPTEARPVFDILNCGPRSRFVVKGEQGPFIVHNCTQALARIVVFEQMLEIEKKYGRRPGQGVVLTVHDEVVALVQEDLAEEALQFMLGAMSQAPKWWPDLPVKAEGDIGTRYSEAK